MCSPPNDESATRSRWEGSVTSCEISIPSRRAPLAEWPVSRRAGAPCTSYTSVDGPGANPICQTPGVALSWK